MIPDWHLKCKGSPGVLAARERESEKWILETAVLGASREGAGGEWSRVGSWDEENAWLPEQ